MPHSEPRDYFVTMRRDSRTAWLAGPFKTHTEALANVERTKTEAQRIDPWADFDAFGTASLPVNSGRVGVLNKFLYWPWQNERIVG